MMNYPQYTDCFRRQCNGQYTTTLSSQKFVVGDGFSFLSFSAYQWPGSVELHQNKLAYNFFDFSTSTKYCVVQGSGQDRELEVEQSIRIATEQKGQTYTKLGFLFFKFGSGSKCSLQPFVSFLKPNFSSESLWAEINTKQNNP